MHAQDQEVVNRLVPVSPQSLEEASMNTRIQLQAEETLLTGDHIDAPLAFDIPKRLAENLGLGELLCVACVRVCVLENETKRP